MVLGARGRPSEDLVVPRPDGKGSPFPSVETGPSPSSLSLDLGWGSPRSFKVTRTVTQPDFSEFGFLSTRLFACSFSLSPLK